MDFKDYMKERSRLFALQTINKESMSLLSASNSLGGEVGEFQNTVKKIFRDMKGNPQQVREKLISELGDIEWYWFFACEVLHIQPEDVLKYNINKLKERHDLS